MRLVTNIIERAKAEPALVGLVVFSFLLNAFYFTFPIWNPDYLVRYAWRIRGLTEWNHNAFFYGSGHINTIKIFIAWPMLVINWIYPLFAPGMATLYIARLLSAAMGAGCVAFTWGIARTLGGRSTAFVAAFGLATTPLLINLAHFTTADIPSCFYAIGGVYFMLRLAETPDSRKWFYLSAIFIGLSASTKYVGVLFGAGAAMHFFLRFMNQDEKYTIRHALIDALQWGSVVIVTFALTSAEMFFFPSTVIENNKINFDINTRMVESGKVDIGFIALIRLTRNAIGLWLLLICPSGMVLALVENKTRNAALIVMAALAAYYIFFGIAFYHPLRYVLPMLPFVFIFVGVTFGVLWELANRHSILQKAFIAIAVVAAVFFVLRAGAASASFSSDTRLQAEKFLSGVTHKGDVIASNGKWYIYFPAMPDGAILLDLSEAPPEGYTLEEALRVAAPHRILTSSLVNLESLSNHEKQFYEKLAADETEWILDREFKRERSIFLNPGTMEFLNPTIRIYKRPIE